MLHASVSAFLQSYENVLMTMFLGEAVGSWAPGYIQQENCAVRLWVRTLAHASQT